VLIDSSGEAISLHELYDGKTIVLSFIYTSCPDVNGCPLATFVLGQVQKRLAQDEQAVSNVRLVSVSFDPANDPPEIMAEYGKHFRRGAVDWRFLTAESEASLSPILENYDQAVIRDRGPDGKALTTMSHILRVYLIDADKRIRNIYSPSYLHPDILYADIRTTTVLSTLENPPFSAGFGPHGDDAACCVRRRERRQAEYRPRSHGQFRLGRNRRVWRWCYARGSNAEY
jgi:cytochrome oxidase Cu insertion factor (SCO1/SenC/PrrC family)